MPHKPVRDFWQGAATNSSGPNLTLGTHLQGALATVADLRSGYQALDFNH
jgi:hypothetical protein